MANLPPNINWLEQAAEQCETDGAFKIPVGDGFVVSVARYDPDVHGDEDDA